MIVVSLQIYELLGSNAFRKKGIDFVMKKGSGTCDALADGRPVSVLHLQGRYVPGGTAEQWRGEEYCEQLSLYDLLERLPHYTITSMVGSKRIEKEKGQKVAWRSTRPRRLSLRQSPKR
jgi:hypothetical protein